MLRACAALLLCAAAAALPTSCERNVSFFGPWAGGDAWLVNYTGPYDNNRPPHVQVGKKPDVTAGQFACLGDIRATTSKAIEWTIVEGVFNKALNEPAHFTVYYGPDASSKVDEFR